MRRCLVCILAVAATASTVAARDQPPEIVRRYLPSDCGRVSFRECADYGADAYRLKVVNGRLEISGDAAGLVFGAYDALERFCGIRFLASDCDFVPKGASWRLPAKFDAIERPAFAFRDAYWADAIKRPFAERLRLNDSARTSHANGWFCHTFGRLVPARRHFAENPEYFALVAGKRRQDAQLCLSNPRVAELARTALLEEIRRDGGRHSRFSVSQNDCNGFCECPQCQEQRRKFGTSGYLLRFVNGIAEQVAGSYPDVTVTTLAYMDTMAAPVGVVPAKNVEIWLCFIDADAAHPYADAAEDSSGRNARVRSALEGWGKVAPGRIVIWDYTTAFKDYLCPYPNEATLAANLRWFAKNGVCGVFSQGAYESPVADLSELKAYLISKLLWNPAADDKALTEEFVRLYYGEKAAPSILEYLDYRRRYFENPKMTLHCIRANHGALGVGDGFVRRSLELWRAAMSATENKAPYAERVRRGALPSMLQAFTWPRPMEARKVLARDILAALGENRNIVFKEWEKPESWPLWAELKNAAAQ